MRKFILVLTIKLFLFTLNAQKANPKTKELILPVGGNSWSKRSGEIRNEGFIFNSTPSAFVSYIHLKNPQNSSANIKALIKIKMKTNQTVNVKLKFGEKSAKRSVKGSDQFKQIPIYYFNLKNGYNKLKVIISSPKTIASIDGQVESIIFKFFSKSIIPTYVDKRSLYYYGRRGPNGYLNYQIKEQKQIGYFYNEVLIPKGSDKIGSYFMVNGFKEGYFGILVYSATERRVFFSVQSEYDPQNPILGANPDNYKVVPVKVGPGVIDDLFGGQGAGRKSYLRFNWTAGTTYKFLTKAQPQTDNSTVYTSWFYDPVAAKGNTKVNAGWVLIASFKKPRINTYLHGLNSFIQCFYPQYGNITRKANYKNQHIYGSTKKWISVNQAKFTHDNTARKNQRVDVQGGNLQEQTGFYLKNGGFFNPKSKQGDLFKRKDKNITIDVDLNGLP